MGLRLILLAVALVLGCCGGGVPTAPWSRADLGPSDGERADGGAGAADTGRDPRDAAGSDTLDLGPGELGPVGDAAGPEVGAPGRPDLGPSGGDSALPGPDALTADLSPADAGPPPHAGHGPPYPIVLQHGWTGFEDIGPIDYFFRVREHLESYGFVVRVSEVAPYQNSTVRGGQLAANLDRILAETGAARVNIIAHSQGGIDTRYVISTLGYGDRIASLTTVSTPHRGTTIGDAYLGLIPGWTDGLADALSWLLGRVISEAGDDPDLRASMDQVSAARMALFNQENPDDPRVAYYSWAGRSFLDRAEELCDDAEMPNPERVDICTPFLQLTGRFIGDSLLNPRPNDGLVTVESARWGRFRGCIPADHIDEVGHLLRLSPDPFSGFSHLRFYLGLAQFVRSEGF